MAPIHPPLALGSELTLRYWYRQMDIQLDSILSTTVSDLRVNRCLTFQGPAGSRSPPQYMREQRPLWPLGVGIPSRMVREQLRPRMVRSGI